jgi:hypothetical protein
VRDVAFVPVSELQPSQHQQSRLLQFPSLASSTRSYVETGRDKVGGVKAGLTIASDCVLNTIHSIPRPRLQIRRMKGSIGKDLTQVVPLIEDFPLFKVCPLQSKAIEYLSALVFNHRFAMSEEFNLLDGLP